MNPSEMTPGELWDSFVAGFIDYETLIVMAHKGSFVRNLFRFRDDDLWGARALRAIADELDRRESELCKASTK